MLRDDLNVLWKPSQEGKEKSNLMEFKNKYINHLTNIEDVNYQMIWQWSVDNPEKFWNAVWDYSNVIGVKGSQYLADKDKMPGAKFFPDSKLNYAENILAQDDRSLAIISEREDGLKFKIKRNDLKKKVLLMAGWLKENGIKKGDRVAAYMPNCPETIITMLATASLGAVFSSCSTDFGVSGVLDRFLQIEPKVLVTVDGYLYNGKSIDRSNEVNEIVNHYRFFKCFGRRQFESSLTCFC